MQYLQFWRYRIYHPLCPEIISGQDCIILFNSHTLNCLLFSVNMPYSLSFLADNDLLNMHLLYAATALVVSVAQIHLTQDTTDATNLFI